jgi:hypothetical protein
MSEAFQQPTYAALTLSQVFDRIFRLMRSNFRLLVTRVRTVSPICLRVINYHQRILHEGFDIEFMMNAAGMNASAYLLAPDASGAVPQAEGA